jgi:ribonuclease R
MKGAMARPLPTRSDILQSLGSEPRALHAAELGARLSVAPGSRKAFAALLEQLAAEGTLIGLPGRRFKAPDAASRPRGWEGTLSVNPRGFGFVNAVGHDDVYVPPEALGAALHGDVVRVEVVARSQRGVEGRVVDVVSRRNPRISGLLVKRRKSAWLEPDDARIRGPIVLTDERVEGKDGDAAVALITRFPASPRENPEGRLVGVLGAPGDPRVEIEKILMREGIVEGHSEDSLREAKARLAALTPVSLEGREDLLDVPFLTIDPIDARDHDDAVFAEKRSGGYRAIIAIADVSEFVQPGGALDLEASTRCFTTYLPDRAVPMLPSELAADQCSLLPDRDRYALCCIVDLDSSMKVRRVKVVEAVIRAQALISYEDAARALGYMAGEPHKPEAKRFLPQLKVLDEIARKLRKARLRRGALDLDLPEPKVELDRETGAPTNISARAKDPGVKATYQLVEEFMLLANERVARFLSERGSPAVYRVHGAPDEDRLEQLALAAKRLGAPFDVDASEGPLGLSRWKDSLADHLAGPVLEMLLLRSLKQAQYDIVNIGHFGLALDSYVHFTSPIRRYPDLLVHRLLKGLLRGGAPKNKPDEVEDLRSKATLASRAERTVMQAEREVVDVYRCLFMRRHVGDEFEARVTGISGSGVYASVETPFVDVMVRFEALGPDHYEVRDDSLGVVGSRSGESILLGDRLRVLIEDVALERRTVYARRLPSLASAEPKPRRGRRKDTLRPEPAAREELPNDSFEEPSYTVSEAFPLDEVERELERPAARASAARQRRRPGKDLATKMIEAKRRRTKATISSKAGSSWAPEPRGRKKAAPAAPAATRGERRKKAGEGRQAKAKGSKSTRRR